MIPGGIEQLHPGNVPGQVGVVEQLGADRQPVGRCPEIGTNLVSARTAPVVLHTVDERPSSPVLPCQHGLGPVIGPDQPWRAVASDRTKHVQSTAVVHNGQALRLIAQLVVLPENDRGPVVDGAASPQPDHQRPLLLWPLQGFWSKRQQFRRPTGRADGGGNVTAGGLAAVQWPTLELDRIDQHRAVDLDSA